MLPYETEEWYVTKETIFS